MVDGQLVLKRKGGISVHDYCRSFCESSTLRALVLGTSRFSVDLCGALGLPVEVAVTSLLLLQHFLSNFDASALERPLICGACVLLGWKYCEDFEEIRSVRKLNDICREIFKLLMFPVEDSEEENSDIEVGSSIAQRKMKVKEECLEQQTSQSGEGNGNDTKRLPGSSCNSEKSEKVFDQKQCCGSPPIPNWRKQLEPLSASTWTLRDEGREFSLMKDRIRLFESALLRCIDFEVGPTLLPFEEMKSLVLSVWLQEVAPSEPISNHKRPPEESSEQPTEPAEGSVGKGEELPASRQNKGSAASPQSNSDSQTKTGCEFHRAKRHRTMSPTGASSHSDGREPSCGTLDGGISNEAKMEDAIMAPDPQKSNDVCANDQQSSKLGSSCRDHQIEFLCPSSDSADPLHQLSELLRLSSGHIVDLYRSPFCLLSNPAAVGAAAVWKASVALGFRKPFEQKVQKYLQVVQNAEQTCKVLIPI